MAGERVGRHSFLAPIVLGLFFCRIGMDRDRACIWVFLSFVGAGIFVRVRNLVLRGIFWFLWLYAGLLLLV